MAALNPRQREFVVAKVFNQLNNSRAARSAGYADVKEQGYRLAHQEDVKAALREVGEAIESAEGPKSLLTMVLIRDNPTAKNADRLRAAEMLANLGGFAHRTESHVYTHDLSAAETERQIRLLLRNDPEAAKWLAEPTTLVDDGTGTFSPAVNASGPILDVQPEAGESFLHRPTVEPSPKRPRKKQAPRPAPLDGPLPPAASRVTAQDPQTTDLPDSTPVADVKPEDF
jgi:hypothetical protein